MHETQFLFASFLVHFGVLCVVLPSIRKLLLVSLKKTLVHPLHFRKRETSFSSTRERERERT